MIRGWRTEASPLDNSFFRRGECREPVPRGLTGCFRRVNLPVIPRRRSPLTPTPGRAAGWAVAAAIRSRFALGHAASRGQTDELIEVRTCAHGARNRRCGASRHESLKGVFALPAGVFIERHRGSPTFD